MGASEKYVVITSIHAPTEAVAEYARWKGWRTVVVGDRRTPPGWALDGATYLSIEDQHEQLGAFSRSLPENAYARKMAGYAWCIRRGAAAIFETDDDNVPLAGAERTLDMFLGWRAAGAGGARLRGEAGWLNVYRHFGAAGCWPRGYPLDRVRTAGPGSPGTDGKPWAVAQFLADDDPDVDAIYRMVVGRPVRFAKKGPVVLDEGTYCPVNSQATLWTPPAYPLLYLPINVPGRVTDILRGLILTACLWRAGQAVAFAAPVVYQRRNPHRLHEDFLEELALYRNADAWSKRLLGIRAARPADAYREALRILADDLPVPEDDYERYELFLNAAEIEG